MHYFKAFHGTKIFVKKINYDFLFSLVFGGIPVEKVQDLLIQVSFSLCT